LEKLAIRVTAMLVCYSLQSGKFYENAIILSGVVFAILVIINWQRYVFMKILFLGTHGQFNIGDELLLETFLSQLGPEHDFAVNSYDPAFTQQAMRPKFKVESFHTTRELPRFLKYLITSDLLFFGGGSIIKELRQRRAKSVLHFVDDPCHGHFCETGHAEARGHEQYRDWTHNDAPRRTVRPLDSEPGGYSFGAG
jgi:hypothetical protein